MIHGHRLVRAAGLGLLLAAAPAAADTVTLSASKDNTLYQDGTGGLSNGAGAYFFAGRAGSLRRAVLAFDIAAGVPAGATIQAAQLTLNCSRLPFFNPPPASCELHALSADWGEGTSDAGDPGGTGTTATAGDATWIHTFFPGTLWINPGGDYVAVTSASQSVAGLGPVVFGSTAQMVADVQSWLDNPATNYGWILLGDESQQNARRFDSRDHTSPSVRPALQIEYTPGTVAVEARVWAAVKDLYR